MHAWFSRADWSMTAEMVSRVSVVQSMESSGDLYVLGVHGVERQTIHGGERSIHTSLRPEKTPSDWQ